MYAFVHIEKTAGTTVNSILRRSFGTRHCDVRLPLSKRSQDALGDRPLVDAADLSRVRRLYRNLRGIAGHHVKPYSNLSSACPEIQFFTILRDPAARFRSHFLNRGPGPTREAFDRWISRPTVHNWQTQMIAGEPNAERAIELISTRFGFVGLTECFDESLILLGDWLAEPGFRPHYRPLNQISEKLRGRDRRRKQTDMSYLDSDEVRAQIAQANAQDQKVYDFVASTIYPRQRDAYPGNLEQAVDRLRQQNRAAGDLVEPAMGRLVRNYVYKPLLHCRAV